MNAIYDDEILSGGFIDKDIVEEVEEDDDEYELPEDPCSIIRTTMPALGITGGGEIKTDEYEKLKLIQNKLSNLLLGGFDEVKQFITSRNRILYGGMAIDFALRLKGDCIYSEASLKFPDYDFYSPSHIKDAYYIADMLYKHGIGDEEYEISAIRALHPTSMKVRLFYEPIADISYLPEEQYNIIPTLKYKDFTFVHPHWQSISIHTFFSFPLQNAPREAIFERLKKDSQRFMKLYKWYPTEYHTEDIKLHQIPWPTYIKKSEDNLPSFLYYGFAAYAIILEEYKKLGIDMTNIIDVKCNKKGYETPIQRQDIIIIKDLDEGLRDIIGEAFLSYYNDKNYSYFVSNDRPLPYLNVNGKSIPYIHSVLLFMLYNSFVCGLKYKTYKDDVKENKNIYLTFYTSLMNIYIRSHEYYDDLVEKGKFNVEKIMDLPYYIGMNMFSIRNYGISDYMIFVLNKLQYLRTYKSIHREENIDDKIEELVQITKELPISYYPSHKTPHPVFEYETSRFFKFRE
jgi:hypothetical protein